jgi:hypothetical protein
VYCGFRVVTKPPWSVRKGIFWEILNNSIVNNAVTTKGNQVAVGVKLSNDMLMSMIRI